ncbi:MAG: hypothetical protein EA341_02790 [Mongoliibacter sp.]|uniref:hypothetical protein n=1 Tax=Mongoliibacter sp. TaxID=2022438 RepID=UPI0012F1CB6C|nr:hypothetical protein [Mongoliibacter sp.]TVP52670.1 MAG: hypothetical protein EA341_02790 [Mongoliibacter sp.]
MPLLSHNIQYVSKDINLEQIQTNGVAVIELSNCLMVVGSQLPMENVIALPFDFSKILYAGLSFLNLKDGHYNINLGLQLQDYYQNLRGYQLIKNVKNIKSINKYEKIENHFILDKMKFFPSIYVMAYSISREFNQGDLILLKFSKSNFEGVAFEKTQPKENLAYAVSKGYQKFHEDSFTISGTKSLKKRKEIESSDYLASYIKMINQRKISSLISKFKQTPPIHICFEHDIHNNYRDSILEHIKSYHPTVILNDNYEQKVADQLLTPPLEISSKKSGNLIGIAVQENQSFLSKTLDHELELS